MSMIAVLAILMVLFGLVMFSVIFMAKRRKYISVSLTRLIQIQMVISAITGKPLTEIVREMLSGNIKDYMIELALNTLDRLEADGFAIVVDAGLKTLVLEIIRSYVGSKQLFRIGPLRVKL